MKKVLIFLVIITAVFLVSGCSSGGGGTGGFSASDGISITRFTTDMVEVEPGDVFEISGTIENVGGAPCTNIRTELYGLGDWQTRQTASAPSELLPPDTSRNVKGDAADVAWDVTAPSYKTGLDTREFELRVYYDYSTSAIAEIKVATDSYIKSLPQDNQEAYRNALGVKTSQTTTGPISVTVLAPNKVLRSSSSVLRFTVDVQNVGAGRLLNDELPISITSPGQNLDCGIGGTVKLSQGKSKQIRCNVNLASISQGWDTITVLVDLNSYEYYTSKLSSIKVLPTEV